jgi:hypothetical protein
MKSKLFEEKAKTAKTSLERWVHILPDKGDGYSLYDASQELFIGRVLVDANDNWIYDGHLLTLEEQEEVAAVITGNHKEMNDLIRNL